jgi:hypothetical protein
MEYKIGGIEYEIVQKAKFKFDIVQNGKMLFSNVEVERVFGWLIGKLNATIAVSDTINSKYKSISQLYNNRPVISKVDDGVLVDGEHYTLSNKLPKTFIWRALTLLLTGALVVTNIPG